MVQKRLEHHVEYVDGIPMNQFGFRRGRSTSDCVSVFVSDVTRGFVSREHTLALAVDLKGAFSNILPQSIYNRLIELKVSARIINFISFITTVKHLFFNAESKEFRDSYIGVPQGGVLSPLLFNLSLSRIGEVMPGVVKWLMFADDLLLDITSKDLQSSLRLLEKAITDLTPWLAEVGLSISPGKSQLTIFSRANENFENCFIKIEDTVVSAQTDMTYLGIILDKKLTWQKHIREISQKATKTLNLIKSMTRISWGANPSSMLTVLKSLTRSHLEWGSQFFADSAQCNLGPLDRIQNQSLRIILGCMKSTPISILLSESNISPLSIRRTLINRRHMIRNLSWTLNPLSTSLHCLQDRIGINVLVPNPSSGIRSSLLVSFGDVSQIMSKCGRTKKPSLQYEMSWDELTRHVEVDLQSGLEIKSHSSPPQAFSELLQTKYENYIDIYNDGSHDPVKSSSGASFVIPKLNINFSVRLSGLMLIDSCELYAILSAVKEAVRLNLDNVLIISDSQNALNEIKHRMSNSLPHPLLKRIITGIITLIDRGSGVSLVWIPSHSGIRGNELADGWARNALSLPFGNLQGGPPRDLLQMINKDYEHWLNLSWPYSFTTPLTNKYFNYITVKTKRPWFRGVESSRRNINTITRLHLTSDFDASAPHGSPLFKPSLIHDKPQKFDFLLAPI
ncbi:uncharacterized protein LOC122510137 [Leptopilina heterotoma]|uniref:uncharacterized protein LOC122510137 n=1 Tax=Leptopilina heterotoma TaxID=63436 RepID=UPI001CA86441|nr:uncharacterized protein LOC122510137 [Leptopilina heterotoma]